MDKPKLKKIVDTMNELLELNADVFEELGIKFRYAGARYSLDGGGMLKLEMVEKNPDGTETSIESAAYKNLCETYGLKKEWLNKEIFIKGEAYRITGLHPQKEKYPVIITKTNGKRIKCSANCILNAMKQEG